ncbi:MAG: flagellar hook assembly protein FlgD [Spirochaetaceae bacterium]|nr:MAG: flagellar hook assembly protein FlgD [Spirochaetaceae bacterium]
MDIGAQFEGMMSGSERARLGSQIDAFNKELQGSRESSKQLGRDDFLKLLITQLQNQDPTAPMEDKQFIAQMAQFSTLEQMTNMSNDFRSLSSVLGSGRAMQMLGRAVEIVAGDTTVNGVVEEVTGGEFPQILVNDRYYDLEQVSRIKN